MEVGTFESVERLFNGNATIMDMGGLLLWFSPAGRSRESESKTKESKPGEEGKVKEEAQAKAREETVAEEQPGADGEAYEKGGSNSRLATPEEAAALMDLKAELLKNNKDLLPTANVATTKGIIDGKPIDLTANSSKFAAEGTVKHKPFINQKLKTQPTASDIARGKTQKALRAYDSEAKISEHILDNTTPESIGEITITSENDFCTSCENILDVQMKELRPGIKINKVYVKPYKNK